MELTREQLLSTYHEERTVKQRTYLWAISGLLLFFLLSLCFRTAEPGFIPYEMIQTYTAVVKDSILRMLDLSGTGSTEQLISDHIYYFELISRFKNSIITVFAGMAVALSGAVFQTVFKNPLASPNMIGITSGVSLGNLILFLQYGALALSLPFTRYLYCYFISAAILILVLVFGRFVTKDGKFSVVDMILAGSIISQLINVFTLFYQFHMNEDVLMLYQRMTLGTYVAVDSKSLLMFAGIIVLGMVPILLLRFGINVLVFQEEEARMTGLRTGLIRFTVMIAASLLVTCAVIHCGSMGMIAMIIPHISRCIVGADFRKVALMSMFSGGGIMLLCRMVSSVIYLNGEPLPVNFVISVVTTPVFIVILLKQRRGFE